MEASRVDGGEVMRQRVEVGKEAVEAASAAKGINLSGELIVKLLMPVDERQHEGNFSTLHWRELN